MPCCSTSCSPPRRPGRERDRALVTLDEALWLDPDVTDPRAVLPWLRPYPAEAMEGYPVSPLVSSVQNDGPELVRPLAE